MKTRISKLTSGSALVVIAALTVAFSFASAQTAEKNRSSARTVEGAWGTMVTPVNCQTGDPLAPAFPGLFTFNAGGTMSEYGISPGQGQTPALRSPGHGVWQREHGHHGEHNYSFSFIFYRYNTSGMFIGSQKITAALELGASGDEFTTRSAVEIFDANGNLIGTGCATAAGTRFE
jgi:hypothetical protein